MSNFKRSSARLALDEEVLEGHPYVREVTTEMTVKRPRIQ